MVSSLSRFRHLLKPAPSEQAKTCVYDQGRDRTRDEMFPVFSKDLYFSVFPSPLNARDRRIDDNLETDFNQFFKDMYYLGFGRLGKSYSAYRIDLTPYSTTVIPKKDRRRMVVVTKMHSKRVDYIDAVRAVEPFMLPKHDASQFICKVFLCFRSNLPYLIEHYCVVSEYWQYTFSLCHRLQHVGCMSENDARFYITELVEAVAHVHKYGKILSLLIDPLGHLKLVPYTLCEQNLDCGQSCNMLVKNCGDQFYASPEVVFGMEVQSATDWWSVGVIFFQLLSGELPFTGRTLGDLGKAITECHPCIPDHVSGEATAFLKHMLHKDPRRRLGFCESVCVNDQGAMNVRDHPFFQHVLWDSVKDGLQQPPFIPRRTHLPPDAVYRETLRAAPNKEARSTNP